MTPDIDGLLTRLRHTGPDRGLDQLEPLVWTRIAATRQREAGALWGWRTSVAAAVLAIGVAVGGAAAARPSTELALFSANAHLAPSTLLEISK